MLALFLLAGIGVTTNFEGGNLGKVEQVSATHLRCAVQGQADQDGRNRQADWYYFKLENLPSRQVTIDLVNLAGEYNYKSPAYSVTKGTRPVYSYDGVSWRHFTDSQVSWDEREPHLTVQFLPEHDRMWIAHVPPYTNQDLAALLDAFRNSPYLERQVVGKTVDGRDMPLLTITNSKIPEAGKKVLWLMFRQHAWETGTSWVGDGAIRFLLADDERAARIRDRVIVKIFPMADPDGVARGGVRFNRNGYDLNRNWDTLDAAKMPEIASQYKAIAGWLDAGHRLDLFLSQHNTEKSEYLESAAGDQDPLARRVFQLLKETTTFNPTSALRSTGVTTTPGKPGRMTVAQGLYHHRKIPAMLMEQMIEYNPKLGRCPTVMDRTEFGAGLVRAMAEALTGGDGYTSHLEAYLDRAVLASEAARGKAWNRNFASLDDYRVSVAPNRARFIETIGGFGRYARTPLAPRIERLKGPPAFTAERVTLHALPDVEVSGVLLVPAAPAGRKPLVIVQHGMGGTPEGIAGLTGEDDSYHRIGRRLAERGFVVWVNKMTQGQETKSRLDRKAQLVGQRLQALEQWILLRAVDYLVTRPEILPERIAIYGKSWGGRTALYAGAIDERISAVVVNGHFNETVPKMLMRSPHYTAYLHTKEDYAFFPNLANEFSDSDIASLICPRALYIEQGARDPVVWYPMARKEFDVVHEYYRKLRIADRAVMEVFDGVHEIHGVNSVAFLEKWLVK
ncbi:MAG TPA: M14-type cytosolic carboxypeptidase [Bryobacteraceae bacterium]|nr:M14-type cytosolic carboxypeptidase [Bryobacteraceae bacterium]